MAKKIQNPNTVIEWVEELHRVAATTGGYTRVQRESANQALENVQARFGAWIKENPNVEVPDFIKSQKWAQ
jgi:hypothetical protein